MSLTIDLTAEETKRFEEAGIDLTSLLKGIAATLPPQQASSGQTGVEIDPKNLAAITYLQAKINRAITDSEAIKDAEAEITELQNRLNANRIAAGEAPMYPE